MDVIGSYPAVDSLGSFEAARIAAGRPRFGIDVTPDMLVNETPLLSRAVSFTKGCYPGQESVARVRNLGRVRRRVVGLQLGAPAPPGTPLLAGDVDIGRLTSSAGLHAIAYARADIGDDATVGGAPAIVRALD